MELPFYTINIDGSKGALGTCDPTPRPISFIFKQFSAKILSNNRFCVPLNLAFPVYEILDPPLLKLL